MRRIAPLLTLVVLLAVPAVGGPVTVWTDRTAFEAATGAMAVPIPDSSTCLSRPYLICWSLTIPIGPNEVEVRGFGGRVAIFDAGTVQPSMVPDVMIANTIVPFSSNAFWIDFAQPVYSVALRLITNDSGYQMIGFWDTPDAAAHGGYPAMFDTIALHPMAVPNGRRFLGFSSTTPIAILFLQFGDGTTAEGLDLIEIGGPAAAVPEPASLLLLGTGLIGAVRAARRKRG